MREIIPFAVVGSTHSIVTGYTMALLNLDLVINPIHNKDVKNGT